MKGKKTSSADKMKKVSAPASKVSVTSKANMVPKVTEAPKNNFKIRPLADRIIIKPITAADTEKKNEFGIIIPDTVSKEAPERGVVMAVGEGKYVDGALVPVNVQVGDTVIFSKYGFDEVKVDGDEFYILKEDSVLAVVGK